MSDGALCIGRDAVTGEAVFSIAGGYMQATYGRPDIADFFGVEVPSRVERINLTGEVTEWLDWVLERGLTGQHMALQLEVLRNCPHTGDPMTFKLDGEFVVVSTEDTYPRRKLVVEIESVALKTS